MKPSCRVPVLVLFALLLLPALAAARGAVSVRYLDGSGKELAISNGTWIEEGLILPLSSLSGASRVEVLTEGGRKFVADRFLSAKPDVDLALLAVSEPAVEAIDLGTNASFTPGGKVFGARGPAGEGAAVSATTIAYKFYLRGADYVALNGPLPAGAPAMRPDSSLLGVAFSLSEPPDAFHWVVTVSSLLRLVEGRNEPRPFSDLPIPVAEWLDPHAVGGLVFRGANLVTTGALERGRNYLALAAKLQPQSEVAHFWLGMIGFKESHFEDAVAEFQLATQCAPTWHLAWHWAGVASFQGRRYEAAEEFYTRALAVDSTSAVTWCNLGGLHVAQNRPDLAIDEFKRSMRLDPGFWLAYANLAKTYKNTGRMIDAEEIYQKVRAGNPEQAARLRKELDAP